MTRADQRAAQEQQANGAYHEKATLEMY